jgi:uncharacterized protein YbjT (DUF2867 family)
MNIALSGASGLIGSYLLEQLLNSETVDQVHILVRKKLDKEHPKLIQHVTDFEELEKVQLNKTIDASFCALGTTLRKAGSKEVQTRIDRDYVIAFAKWSKSNGAERIGIVSSLGATAKTSNFYLRLKGEMEQKVGDMQFSHTTFIRPSLLLGPRQEFRFGEKVGKAVMTVLNPLFVGKANRYRAVHAQDVADTLIHETMSTSEKIRFVESEEIIGKPSH